MNLTTHYLTINKLAEDLRTTWQKYLDKHYDPSHARTEFSSNIYTILSQQCGPSVKIDYFKTHFLYDSVKFVVAGWEFSLKVWPDGPVLGCNMIGSHLPFAS